MTQKPIKILADSALPNLSQLFKAPFTLTQYTSAHEVADKLPTQNILLCRSTLKVTPALLQKCPIQCVATASSGVDHIDTDYLKQHQIALFDAKGCNASAVADYIMSTLAYLFQHHLIMGLKAGVIGLGEVGQQVVTRLKAIGFEVICYDPPRQAIDTSYPYCELDLLTQCDLLCVHPNFHTTKPYPSANLLDLAFLNQLKPGTVIINAARGGIVNEAALLKTMQRITYCTDVYQDEPHINPDIVKLSTLCTPHIAGHSIEAKEAAMIKISEQLHDYYGLTKPSIKKALSTITPIPFTKEHWIERVLSLYNPLLETHVLKSAHDKTLAFLDQRKAHHNRHGFLFNFRGC